MKQPKHFMLLFFLTLSVYSFAHEPANSSHSAISVPLTTADTTDATAEEEDFPLTFGFDLVSRYIWRGVDFGFTPAFQPGLTYSVGNDKVSLDVGAWASYSLTGNFAEADLLATLNFPYVWVGLIDYFFPVEASGDDQYFHYGDNTLHVFEGLVGFDGPDKFPISAYFAYNFHSPVTDPDNSLYFELGYPFSLKKDVSLDIFAGAAHGSYYTQSGDFNVVNVGMKFSKSFSIKDKVQIPLSVSLITNPDAQKVYFVAAVGLWNQ